MDVKVKRNIWVGRNTLEWRRLPRKRMQREKGQTLRMKWGGERKG